MTWVKGTTTWANLANDLTKLACGEIADGQAVPVTVAVGDRWVREYDTTVNAMRSPASKDVPTGACSMRTGYWALTTPGTNGAGFSTFVRQVTCQSVKPAWVGGSRWMYRFIVSTVNTVSGDYSTARLLAYSWDSDSGSYNHSGNSITPAADGTCTFDGMSFKIGDPSGFVTLNCNFFRQFTTVYLGGIDYWPMYYRRSAAATFSTAPPGVAGTDYDVCEVATTLSYSSQQPSYSLSCDAWTRSNWGTGLGIKTNVALTGAVYVLSFPMALHKVMLYNRTDVAGILAMAYGRMSVDGAIYRLNGGHEVSTFLRPFATAAQVTNAAVINYWMSVKPDSITIVLSGDPGLTGKTTCAQIGTLTPYDTTYDVLPVMFNRRLTDYTVDNGTQDAHDQGTQMYYWAVRKRLDGTEGSRDWQTKWMRCDLMELGAAWSGQAFTWDRAPVLANWGSQTDPNGRDATSMHPNITPIRQLKPHPYDAKWWMYGLAYGDVAPETTLTTPANPGTMDHRQVRGIANSRWWFLPGDGWANLDELTDSVTAAKYLLVAADYHGIAGRYRVGTATYAGGVAIAEV